MSPDYTYFAFIYWVYTSTEHRKRESDKSMAGSGTAHPRLSSSAFISYKRTSSAPDYPKCSKNFSVLKKKNCLETTLNRRQEKVDAAAVGWHFMLWEGGGGSRSGEKSDWLSTRSNILTIHLQLRSDCHLLFCIDRVLLNEGLLLFYNINLFLNTERRNTL